MNENIGKSITSVQYQSIDWHAAARIATAAAETAKQSGIQVAVAVVDRSGDLVAFLRMPGAFLHSRDIAIDKAYTAAGFGIPTKALAEILDSQEANVRSGLLFRPRLVAIGGGMPILLNGEIVGAIGVSGGTENQDIECAMAGLARPEIPGQQP